jgi:hypothetical protein
LKLGGEKRGSGKMKFLIFSHDKPSFLPPFFFSPPKLKIPMSQTLSLLLVPTYPEAPAPAGAPAEENTKNNDQY